VTTSLRDFAMVPRIAEARLSPDAKRIAYTVVTIDLEADRRSSSIWSVDVGQAETPHQVLGDAFEDAQLARWAPDGRRIAFAAHEGSIGWSIWLSSPEGTDRELLARCGQEAVEDLEWSPDGESLCFTARINDPVTMFNGKRKVVPVSHARTTLDAFGVTVGRRRHLFVIDANRPTGPRQLTFGDFEDEGIAWSPDSKRIAFISARGETWDLQLWTDVYTVELSSGHVTEIRSNRDLHTTWSFGNSHLAPTWSADGTKLARVVTIDQAQPHRHGQIAVMRSDGSKDEILTEALDRNIRGYGSGRALQWVQDWIYFLVDDGGADHIYRVRSGGKPEAVLVGDRQVRSFDLVGGTFAVVTTDASHPNSLVVVQNGSEHTVVETGSGVQMQAPIRFMAPNAHGDQVEAWILPPVDRQPGSQYPTILHIHGGPNYQDGYRYSPEKQAYAAAGYAVIYSNPRGSTGYDEKWARVVRGTKAATDPGLGFGDPAFEDVMAVVDEATKRFDFVDRDRLGVTGTSYGGFMTAWTLGSTDRFKAGVCVNSSTNLATIIWRGDAVVPWLSGQLGVDVLADAAEAYANSPMSRAEGIRTPLLIMHAEQDYGCPIGQSIQLFTFLRFRRRTVEMVRFPDASHVLASPFQLRERLRLTLEWFDRHVRNSATSKVGQQGATV